MEENRCSKAMRDALKMLESAGFPAVIGEDGTLTSFFALDMEGNAFAYTAECLMDGRPQSHAGFRGVMDALKELDCPSKLKFYEALLSIPASYNLGIGVDRDLILAYFPPGEESASYTYIGSTYAFAVNLAGWLLKAIEALKGGREIPGFQPE